MAMMTSASVAPILPLVIKALICAKKVLTVIERKPEIDSDDKSRSIKSLTDGVTFSNVKFRYPTAPENSKDVFKGVSFKIKAGTSTAIVGPSGCGKSTIVQLINRYYDPDEGSI